MSLKTFINQCLKRKIFKGFSIYAISSWLIIQVAATTFPYLGLPKEAVTFIIIIALIGLPFSLVFSWYYNVVPDELDEEKEVMVISDRAASKIFKAILLIITLIVIGIVIILVNKNFKSDIKRVSSNRIAVLDFQNASGLKEFDLLGKIIADWIEHGIIENKLATVVSSEVINNYTGSVKPSETLNSTNNVLEKLAVGKSITGGIYKDGDNLFVNCSIFEWPDNESSFAFESVKVDPNDPNEGMNILKNKVLGYLLSSEKRELQLQDSPPNYEAYKLVVEAGDLINDLDPRALQLLDEALEIDSTYFEAKLLRLSYFYGIGEFARADSLRLTIVPDSRTNSRQANLLNFYNALLSGKNKVIYETWKREYQFAPFSLNSNQSMMVIALQFVYKPFEIQEIYEEIDMENLDFSICPACIYREFLMANAYLELGNFRKVQMLIEPHLTVNIDPILINPLIASYVRSGNLKKLEKLFSDLPRLIINQDMSSLYRKAIKELKMAKLEEEAQQYYIVAKENLLQDQKSYKFAQLLFLAEMYVEAEVLLQELYLENQLGSKGKSLLAISRYLNGKIDLSDKLISEIENGKDEYDFGTVEYNLALVESYKDNQNKVLQYLSESVANGYIYGPEEFHNELAFQKYRNQNAFKRLLTYWH